MKKIITRLLYTHHPRNRRYRFCLALRFPSGDQINSYRLARWDVYYDDNNFVTSIRFVVTCHVMSNGMFLSYHKISKRNHLYKTVKKYCQPHIVTALHIADQQYDNIEYIDLYNHMGTGYYCNPHVSLSTGLAVNHSREKDFFYAVLRNVQERGLAKVSSSTTYDIALLPKFNNCFEKSGVIQYDKSDNE